MKKLFDYIMAYLTVSLSRFLGYTPEEVIEMYDRTERGLPVFDDRL